MDASAIKIIQDNALAVKTSERLLETDIPTTLVPDGFKIESLEIFNQSPSRHKERFITQYLSDFFAYANDNLTDDTTVFVNENPATALAIFDKSKSDQPRWQDHNATLRLKHTPALADLLTNNNKIFSQQDLIDFAIDWKEQITFFSDEDVLDFADAIARIRRLKITQTNTAEINKGDFSAKKTALEQIEIDAAGAPLPSHFVFTTPPYLQFQDRDYTAQIRALDKDDKPQLKYRLMGLPAIELAIAEEFKETIKKELSAATIYIGGI